MERKEAVEIYSQAMKRANAIGRESGAPSLITGSLIKAFREIWEDAGKPGDFDLWRRSIIRMVRFPKNKHVSSSDNGHARPKYSKRNNGRGPFIGWYQDYAMRHDVMPQDAYLSEEWEIPVKTIQRTRGKLKEMGFEWNIDDRTQAVEVLSRPEPVIIPPPAPVVVEVKQLDLESVRLVPEVTPENRPVVSAIPYFADMVDRLDKIVALLDRIAIAWSA